MSKTIREWQKAVYANATARGFHSGDDPAASIWKALGNLHGEISEAWEEARQPDFDPTLVYCGDGRDCPWNAASQAVGGDEVALGNALASAREGVKPDGFAIELADVAIRLMDTAEMFGIDLEAAIAIKHEYNGTRDFRHGGKRA